VGGGLEPRLVAVGQRPVVGVVQRVGIGLALGLDEALHGAAVVQLVLLVGQALAELEHALAAAGGDVGRLDLGLFGNAAAIPLHRADGLDGVARDRRAAGGDRHQNAGPASR